ncbi:polysaccharide biosynthesis protein [Brevundimonas sp. 2R-24]|uniref:Polysaccharide biosynthesis protein n=1 Tax=Peiella sedimenti TaxID=3061083 RepID=A0ABT8SN69_9CAUL|nr:polysaccharide biosynthesis protein [Caulobacteraceae bacterium XZ-24]
MTNRLHTLLARNARDLEGGPGRELIEGRRVLVTGAGGTIGSELTRRVARMSPARLIAYDASEYNLYAVDQELSEIGRGRLNWTAALGDVRDETALRHVFEDERPEVVLHAAALKHVPLMERHPCEAVLTNVGGTVNVMRMARETADAFLFISTDKAVNPTNVMGATKRVGEKVVQALSQGAKSHAAIVRFGNVLGSTGSVVPLFEKQIQRGGPVTVTHPDITRWFMTVEEAAGLVLQAAALPAEPGQADVFVLDMGEPVRIDDLARSLIRLHGLRPDLDIPIAYTGLRPGEKLTEEIFYSAEGVSPTAIEGVLKAKANGIDYPRLEEAVDALLAAAAQRDEAETLRLLHALEPAFRPD